MDLTSDRIAMHFQTIENEVTALRVVVEELVAECSPTVRDRILMRLQVAADFPLTFVKYGAPETYAEAHAGTICSAWCRIAAGPYPREPSSSPPDGEVP